MKREDESGLMNRREFLSLLGGAGVNILVNGKGAFFREKEPIQVDLDAEVSPEIIHLLSWETHNKIFYDASVLTNREKDIFDDEDIFQSQPTNRIVLSLLALCLAVEKDTHRFEYTSRDGPLSVRFFDRNRRDGMLGMIDLFPGVYPSHFLRLEPKPSLPDRMYLLNKTKGLWQIIGHELSHEAHLDFDKPGIPFTTLSWLVGENKSRLNTQVEYVVLDILGSARSFATRLNPRGLPTYFQDGTGMKEFRADFLHHIFGEHDLDFDKEYMTNLDTILYSNMYSNPIGSFADLLYGGVNPHELVAELSRTVAFHGVEGIKNSIQLGVRNRVDTFISQIEEPFLEWYRLLKEQMAGYQPEVEGHALPPIVAGDPFGFTLMEQYIQGVDGKALSDYMVNWCSESVCHLLLQTIWKMDEKQIAKAKKEKGYAFLSDFATTTVNTQEHTGEYFLDEPQRELREQNILDQLAKRFRLVYI